MSDNPLNPKKNKDSEYYIKKKMKNAHDYEILIQKKKAEIDIQRKSPHVTSEQSKIFVCVRKRPISDKEIENGEIDCVSALNPKICIYDCKMKIDGYTKFIDTNEFYYDNVFDEGEDTQTIYECTIEPTMPILLNGGVITCFAYGQTGSGKTFTMKGIQDEAIESLFYEFGKYPGRFEFYVSFFEIYTGLLYDLLNNRNKVAALEDKNNKIQIYGLEEKKVNSPDEMKDIVDYANTVRTTHNTVTNETSSRSHAICNFIVREIDHPEEEYAKLTLVDLAGSERATETQSNNKNRLAEGAEINKSLLALKECIRALDVRKQTGNSEHHVPFRTSKLTLVLRDSFISKNNNSKIIMISCVSPGYSSANHTINTLRYADRLKEKTAVMNKNKNYIENNNQSNNNHSNNRNMINNNSNHNSNSNIHGNKQINLPYKLSNFNNVNTSNNGRKRANTQINKTKPKPRKQVKQIQQPPMVFDNPADDDLMEDNIENLNMNPIPIQEPPYTNNRKNHNKRIHQNYHTNPNNNNSKLSKSTKVLDEDDNFLNNDDKELEEKQDYLISSHMNVIKDEAKLLTEEGNLISNIKGITNENYTMDEYAKRLEEIIERKLEYYKELKKKIEEYKKMVQK